jgi:hypothetical protein
MLVRNQRKSVVLATKTKVIMPELRTISFQLEEATPNIRELHDKLWEKFLRTWRH